MDINSLKTKQRLHNFVMIKQDDKSSSIDLLLCGSDGKVLTELGATATVTVLDERAQKIRATIPNVTVSSGNISFKINQLLNIGRHTIEVVLANGQKFPGDGDFTLIVTESHSQAEINVINSTTKAEALAALDSSIKAFMSANSTLFRGKQGLPGRDGVDGTSPSPDQVAPLLKPYAEQLVTTAFGSLSGKEQSDSEVVLARDGFTSLSDRLNRNFNLSTFTRYGLIDKSILPFDLGFNLYRNTDGRIMHDYAFHQHTDNAVNIYINRQYGLDSNDGLSREKPVAYLKTALDIAHARPESKVNIIFLEKIVYYNLYASGNATNTYSITKNINFLSDYDDGSYIYSGNFPNSFVWSKDDNVYKVARTAVAEVFDSNVKDFRGNPKKLTKMDTLVQCKERLNSWYTDGTSVWVHREDESNPNSDNKVLLILPINTAFVFNVSNSTLFIDNVHFYVKQNTAGSNALLLNGDTNTNFIIRRSSFCFSRNNGLGAKTFNKLYVFDCYAEGIGVDSFNAHASSVQANPIEKVFYFNCYAHSGGYLANNNGNAFTAHDGMKVIGVNLIGHDMVGPVLADVNGCDSIYFDSVMYNSKAATGPTKAAFYADESGALRKGSFVLIDCQGGGADTYAVNSDKKIVPILQNFNGDVPPGLVVDIRK